MNNVLLEMNEVSFSHGKKELITQVSLTVKSGTSVAIMGASGSGKSTMLSLVSGLLKPSQGEIIVNGHKLGSLSKKQKAQLRRQDIGFVYQFGELIPSLTAIENVALPSMFDGESWFTASRRADELLEMLGVKNVLSPAAVLSGGERQRTALARALINDPPLLVADEPTGALDTTLRDGVADELFSRSREEGRALLLVTHDPELANRADVSYVLESGKLWETGNA